jgi:hypothetical protein
MANGGIIQMSAGHFDLDTTGQTLTKACIRGAGCNRTTIHRVGNTGGFTITGAYADAGYTSGNIQDLTLHHDATYAAPAVTITSTDTNTRILHQTKMLDGLIIKTAGYGKAASSMGVYIVTSGTDPYITASHFGQFSVAGMERGIYILCDGTKSVQGPFINTLYFDSVYLYGNTYGLKMTNNSAETNSMQANIFNRITLSNFVTTGIELSCDGDDTVSQNWFGQVVGMDSGTNDIVCGTDCNDNYFAGHFIISKVTDSGTDNIFKPYTWVLDRNDIVWSEQSVDSAAVADRVKIGGYDISAGHRALSIGTEEVVAVETDETKFSHKYPVRINGATYYIMLTAT